MGRRDTTRGPHFEASATPAALLGAGLVVDAQEPLLGAGLMPVGASRKKRESEEARAVQFRETNSCFSGGGTKTLEDMSDRQQPRPTPRRGSDRRRQRSARDEVADGQDSSSGSEKVGNVFQQLHDSLSGSGG
jgi:hypothetical protein